MHCLLTILLVCFYNLYTLRIGYVQFFVRTDHYALGLYLSNSSAYRTWACRGAMAPRPPPLYPPLAKMFSYLIESRSCAFRHVIDEARKLLTSPKRWHKNAASLFLLINLLTHFEKRRLRRYSGFRATPTELAIKFNYHQREFSTT